MSYNRPVTVDNPSYYRIKSQVECIEIVRSLSFDLGSAIKCLWRVGQKDDPLTELRKAYWYLKDLENSDEVWLLVDRHEWDRRFRQHIESIENYQQATILDSLRQAVLDQKKTLGRAIRILQLWIMSLESKDL
jgi:hypothetical protein